MDFVLSSDVLVPPALAAESIQMWVPPETRNDSTGMVGSGRPGTRLYEGGNYEAGFASRVVRGFYKTPSSSAWDLSWQIAWWFFAANDIR